MARPRLLDEFGFFGRIESQLSQTEEHSLLMEYRIKWLSLDSRRYELRTGGSNSNFPIGIEIELVACDQIKNY